MVMHREHGGSAMFPMNVVAGFWHVAEVAVESGWGATCRLLTLMAGLLVFLIVLGWVVASLT